MELQHPGSAEDQEYLRAFFGAPVKFGCADNKFIVSRSVLQQPLLTSNRNAHAALVATLVAGGTLEQHAQCRGISPGTARGQLKQVLSKTGTHRQAELVRLALSSAAAHVLDSVPAVQG